MTDSPTQEELNVDIVSEAEYRVYQGDYVVVSGGYSNDITLHHRDSAPHAIIESDEHEIIHAPEDWP